MVKTTHYTKVSMGQETEGEEFGGSSRNNSFVSVLVLVDLQTSAEREIRYCQHQYHLKHSFEVWMHFKW